MKLSYLPYQGPAFLGAAKIGISFEQIHTVIFGPRGDNYIVDMFSIRERLPSFPRIYSADIGYKELTSGVLPRLTEIEMDR